MKNSSGTLPFVVAMIVLVLGCQPSPTPSLAASPSATPTGVETQNSPSPTPKVAPVDPRVTEIRKRFQQVGPKVVDEYGLDALALHAPALFEHHIALENLHLYSDEPFEKKAGTDVLEKVKKKLQASPIYQSEHSHSAFICNSQWREELFLRGSGRLGGLNYFPASHHVFLTGARIEENALLSPRGFPIARPRTLSYYIAHEFTHTLIGETVGARGFYSMPHWLAEGYPDYVGLGPNYTYDQAQSAYYNRPEEVRGTLAEDYLRYGVMVSFLLETQSVDVAKLLENPPGEGEVKDKCGLK